MAGRQRRRADGDGDLVAASELLTTNHLLLVDPTTATPDVVSALVRARVNDADLLNYGRAQVGRHSAITGPLTLDDAQAEVAEVPRPWRTAYVLEGRPERDRDGFETFVDPVETAMWMRAFPSGMPYREEGALVHLGLDLARRLHGAVRVAGSGVLMRPDPHRDVDLTVWSPYWVEPDDLVALLEPVLPGAHRERPAAAQVPDEEDELWSVHPLDPAAERLDAALTPDLMRELEDVSVSIDDWALRTLDPTDGYAVVGHGGIVVGVHVETQIPRWIWGQLSDLPDIPTDRLVVYDIRWWPVDLSQLHIEAPNPAHRIARSIVSQTMRGVARVTADAVYGVVADAAGFHVPPTRLD